MTSVYEPRKLFNLCVPIVDPIISPLPKNPNLAFSDPNWISVMEFEFDALIKNNTWDFVP